MSSEKEQRKMVELSEKLAAFNEKTNDAARNALNKLRRVVLDSLPPAPLKTMLSGYDVVAAMPTVTVSAVNFRSDIDLDRVRSETREAVHAWASAAAMTGESILFMLESEDGAEIRLRLGMCPRKRTEASEKETLGLSARLYAAFPGLRIGVPSSGNPSETAMKFPCRSLLTGIPLIRNEGELQTFPVDRLIRGMRGRRFAFVLIARPMARKLLIEKLNERRKSISDNHEQINRSFSKELGVSEGLTKGISAGGTAMFMNMAMSAITAGVNAGVGLPGVNVGASLSQMVGTMTGSATGGNLGGHVDQTTTRSRSASSGMEQLDAFAEAYDAALREETERLTLALSEGGWETSAHIFAQTPEETQWAGALIAQSLTGQREAYEPFRVLPVRARSDHSVIGFWDWDSDAEGRIPLYTLMTSSELAAFMGLPFESHPGLEVRRIPRFAVQPARIKETGRVFLGALLDRDVELPGSGFALSEKELASHLLVAGITGSGKSTTLRSILAQLEAPFLVLEPAKKEYRCLAIQNEPVRVFTAGDERSVPLRINPFEIPEGVTLHTHMDALTALFNAAFPMEGPMASLVEQGLWRVYEQVGWDVNLGLPTSGNDPVLLDIPTMDQYYQAMDEVIGQQKYADDYGANIRGALLTRIRSLCGGPRGALFNTNERFNMRWVLEKSTVIEMSSIGNDETKVFLTGLLLWRLYRHFEFESKQTSGTGNLRTLVVIEEAHRLFRRAADNSGSLTASNTKNHSVELFENILAESRAYGLGMAIIEQLPLRLSEGAVKNTTTKIIHRLSARNDAEEMGGAMGLSSEESLQLTRLRVGEALMHRADMETPAHVKVAVHGGYGDFSAMDSDVRERAEKDGYLAVQIKPPGFDALIQSFENRRPGSLLRLGQNLLITLLCGKSGGMAGIWGLSSAKIRDLFLEDHENITDEIGRLAARQSVENALQRRHYLRKDLTWNEEVRFAWRALDVEDRATIHTFRKALLRESKRHQDAPPVWVSERYHSIAAYWAEARQQAAALCVQYPDFLREHGDDEREWALIAGSIGKQLLLPGEPELLELFSAAIAGALQEARTNTRKFDDKCFEKSLVYFREYFQRPIG